MVITRRSGKLVVFAACAALVGLCAPAASAGKRPSDGGGGKPDTPKEWDERVLPFVDFVEEQRELEFDHPVKVRFLSDNELEKELRSENDAQTKADREFEQQIAGEFRALGLVSDEVDLGQASEDLAADNVLGYYDSLTETLVVRDQGSDSIDADVTVVHELTHALQDQHFDLDRLYRGAKSGSEGFALDFLLEGDATTVETAYIETLSRAEQDEYFGLIGEITSEPLPEGVPYALNVFSAAPYVLGKAYVFALDPDGGTTGRDRAFRNPPETEEVLLDPVALEQRQSAKKVPKPALEEGEERAYAPEQFGAFSLYLMFATRFDVRTALAAVTGWGGDSYVGFKEDGDICLRGNVTGDRRTDTDELEEALTMWAAAMPDGASEIDRDGDVITFTACASEGVTEPTVEQFNSAFYNVLGGRIYTVLDVASFGIPLDSSLCVGDLVSTDPEIVAIYDLSFAEGRDLTDDEYDELDAVYLEAFDTCGVDPPS